MIVDAHREPKREAAVPRLYIDSPKALRSGCSYAMQHTHTHRGVGHKLAGTLEYRICTASFITRNQHACNGPTAEQGNSDATVAPRFTSARLWYSLFAKLTHDEFDYPTWCGWDWFFLIGPSLRLASKSFATIELIFSFQMPIASSSSTFTILYRDKHGKYTGHFFSRTLVRLWKSYTENSEDNCYQVEQERIWLPMRIHCSKPNLKLVFGTNYGIQWCNEIERFLSYKTRIRRVLKLSLLLGTSDKLYSSIRLCSRCLSAHINVRSFNFKLLTPCLFSCIVRSSARLSRTLHWR